MRLERIVIGTDFSDTAIAAASWRAVLAPDAGVTFVHGVEPADRPGLFTRRVPPAETVERAACDFATQRLAEIAAEFGAQKPRTIVRVGKPSRVVCEVATEEHADLVIIGAHGERPRPKPFLGTTADRIVRLAPCSVLVARSAPNAPRRLLVPVDDARITSTLLEWTRDVAGVLDAEITLLHVWSNAIYSHVASMALATADNEAKAREEIRAEIDGEASRWLEQAVSAGVSRERVKALVKHGKAGEVILETADAMDADLIVMGRQGSGLVAPALLGSTVSAVLREATSAVLVVAESNKRDT